jgi:acylphosphatase
VHNDGLTAATGSPSAAAPQGVRCVVSGRVQGVFYRRSAQQMAQQLGICGRAVNLPDGRVLVTAWGDAHALEAFVAWLAQGPALARVTDVQVGALDASDAVAGPPSHFSTG